MLLTAMPEASVKKYSDLIFLRGYVGSAANKLTSEIQMNGPLGMILLDDCLLQLVRDGKVDKEQAFMKAFDKDNFIKHIQEMESQQ